MRRLTSEDSLRADFPLPRALSSLHKAFSPGRAAGPASPGVRPLDGRLTPEAPSWQHLD